MRRSTHLYAYTWHLGKLANSKCQTLVAQIGSHLWEIQGDLNDMVSWNPGTASFNSTQVTWILISEKKNAYLAEIFLRILKEWNFEMFPSP